MKQKGKIIIKNDVESAENRNIKSNKSKKLSLIQKLEFILCWLKRLLIGFVTVYMAWISLRADEILWHGLLCTFGFTCLMSEGLTAHYHWTQLCERTERTRLHWLLQLIASLMGLAGISVKIYFEELHFQTVHGKLGLATFVMCFISLGSGLSALFANALNNNITPLLNKSLHCICGLLTFSLAMLCMFFAIQTDLFIEYSLDGATFLDFRLLLQLIIILILTLCSYGPVWSLIYSKFKCYQC